MRPRRKEEKEYFRNWERAVKMNFEALSQTVTRRYSIFFQ